MRTSPTIIAGVLTLGVAVVLGVLVVGGRQAPAQTSVGRVEQLLPLPPSPPSLPQAPKVVDDRHGDNAAGAQSPPPQSQTGREARAAAQFLQYSQMPRPTGSAGPAFGAPNGRFQISAWANADYAGYFVLDTQTGAVVRTERRNIKTIPQTKSGGARMKRPSKR